MRISRKLANINCDIELMFGIFSRGQRTVTKEDFKYCCLHRLQLKKEIADKEMDLFLMGNPYTKGKNYLEQHDFVQIF